MICQQDFDLTPFSVDIPSARNTDEQSSHRLLANAVGSQGGTPDQYEKDESSLSVSPTDLGSVERSLEDISEHQDDDTDPRPATPATQATALRPTPNRSMSNGGSSGGGNRKRTSFHATNVRGRTRPSMVRKRSSQSQQAQDQPKARSALKSPRSSTEAVEVVTGRRLGRTLSSQIVPTSDTPTRSSRTISDLALPSASSWQSIDLHTGSRPTNIGGNAGLAIEKNFREKFVEHQKKINSSTDLAGMNRMMRKTGSVVRFADEVDASKVAQQSEELVQPSSSQAQRKPEGALQSWRQNLQRHDSVGSVAAVSDDGSEGNEADDDDLTMLPRTRSQLSLGIADLKRSQSMIEKSTEFAVTSPEIEVQQEALIKGKNVKSLTEEEEKLLAMGRKDGVTRAGGVNLPRELTVRGRFEFSEDSDSSDQPLY